jgi:nucleotide-binding universal stress UspA family protein
MSQQLVVVGVDGSPASYTALRWTVVHAQRIGARRGEIGQVVAAALAPGSDGGPLAMAPRRTLRAIAGLPA